jgi:hypothetical protein
MRRIFDGLYVDQLFHKNERGETVYYPFGLTGRGYLLPADRETAVRDATRRLSLVSLASGIALALLATRILDSFGSEPLGWVISGGAFVLLLVGLFYYQKRLTNGLEPVPGPRPSAGDWLRSGRQSRPRWTYFACLVLGVVCLAMAGFSFAGAYMSADMASLASGVFLLLVGAALMWDGARGLIERS